MLPQQWLNHASQTQVLYLRASARWANKAAPCYPRSRWHGSEL